MQEWLSDCGGGDGGYCVWQWFFLFVVNVVVGVVVCVAVVIVVVGVDIVDGVVVVVLWRVWRCTVRAVNRSVIFMQLAG